MAALAVVVEVTRTLVSTEDRTRPIGDLHIQIVIVFLMASPDGIPREDQDQITEVVNHTRVVSQPTDTPAQRIDIPRVQAPIVTLPISTADIRRFTTTDTREIATDLQIGIRIENLIIIPVVIQCDTRLQIPDTPPILDSLPLQTHDTLRTATQAILDTRRTPVTHLIDTNQTPVTHHKHPLLTHGIRSVLTQVPHTVQILATLLLRPDLIILLHRCIPTTQPDTLLPEHHQTVATPLIVIPHH